MSLLKLGPAWSEWPGPFTVDALACVLTDLGLEAPIVQTVRPWVENQVYPVHPIRRLEVEQIKQISGTG